MKTPFALTLVLAGLAAACNKPVPPPPPPEVAPRAAKAAPHAPVEKTPDAPAPPPVSAEDQAKAAALTQALQKFVSKNNRMPADLNELVAAGAVPGLPPPPTGMKYVINPQHYQVLLVPAK